MLAGVEGVAIGVGGEGGVGGESGVGSGAVAGVDAEGEERTGMAWCERGRE